MFLLDPSQKLRHAMAEIEANQIDAYKNHLTAANNSDEVYAILEAGARADAKRFSEYLTGRRLSGEMIDAALRDIDRSRIPSAKPGVMDRVRNLVNGKRPQPAITGNSATDAVNPTKPPSNSQ